MWEGEYESLKTIHSVSLISVPRVFAWGKFRKETPPIYFMLTEFREVCSQPSDPIKFIACLAELHRNSISPTGQFGFHVPACDGKLTQVVEWDESWASLYMELAHMPKLDEDKHSDWPEFQQATSLPVDRKQCDSTAP